MTQAMTAKQRVAKLFAGEAVDRVPCFSGMSNVTTEGLEAVVKEGAAGQKKINQWTRLATVPIAMAQTTFIYTGVFLNNKEMIASNVNPGLGLFLLVVLSLTRGSILVMWLGELITEYGVGNGASLIIMAGIIADMPTAIAAMVGDVDFYNRMLFLIGVWFVIVVVIVYITKGARRIPIQYARLTRGRRVYGGEKQYLPLKINMAGVMPIIFASILFMIPGVAFTAIGANWLRDVFTDPQGFVHISLYGAMIFGFCFFWNRLMFNPDEIADNVREHGSFIPGIRPGAKTAEFLAQTLTRLTLATLRSAEITLEIAPDEPLARFEFNAKLILTNH